jgi:hypothetical protein
MDDESALSKCKGIRSVNIAADCRFINALPKRIVNCIHTDMLGRHITCTYPISNYNVNGLCLAVYC